MVLLYTYIANNTWEIYDIQKYPIYIIIIQLICTGTRFTYGGNNSISTQKEKGVGIHYSLVLYFLLYSAFAFCIYVHMCRHDEERRTNRYVLKLKNNNNHLLHHQHTITTLYNTHVVSFSSIFYILQSSRSINMILFMYFLTFIIISHSTSQYI